MNPMIN